VDLFQRAPLLARLRRLGLEEGGKLERVFIDGAGRAPLSVGWLYGLRAQVTSDGVSGDAQAPGYLSQWDLLANVPAKRCAKGA
jgi:hypothetical protein